MMIFTALLVGALVAASVLVDEGEVVQLSTGDSDQETALWIVDLDDASYLRASEPDASWLARLREHPVVTLEREGSQRSFRAVPDAASGTLDRVNRAMAAKYGLADSLWGHLSDRSRAVAVRLERLDGSDESAADDRNAH